VCNIKASITHSLVTASVSVIGSRKRIAVIWLDHGNADLEMRKY
jgi:hypothetical protein